MFTPGASTSANKNSRPNGASRPASQKFGPTTAIILEIAPTRYRSDEIINLKWSDAGSGG